MKALLTYAQHQTVVRAMYAEYDAWKTERLEARENHVRALIADNTGNLDLIRLKQNAIRAIDLELRDRSAFLESLVRAINLVAKVKL